MNRLMRDRAVTDCPITDTLKLNEPAPIMVKELPPIRWAPGWLRMKARWLWLTFGPRNVSRAASLLTWRN